MKSRQLFSVLCFLCLLAGPIRASDSLQKQLAATYKNQQFVISGFYSGDRLTYGANGDLTGGGAPGPWTLNGFIQIMDIKVGTSKVEITGKRLIAVFDLQKGKFEKSPSHKVQIDIALSSDQLTDEDVLKTWRKIFISEDELPNAVPEYWQVLLKAKSKEQLEQNWLDFLKRHSLEAYKIDDHTKGKITPPKVLQPRDPEYTESARKISFQGVGVLRGVVSETGEMVSPVIIRPLGLGLDEAAIRAVEQWKFQPAELNGQPIPAQVTIEVNFRLY